MASMHEKRRLIDPRTAKQLGPRPSKLVRNFAWSPERVEKFAQQHPELVVRAGDDVLVAQPMGQQLRLLYAYDSVEEMRKQFSPMLAQIEEAAQSRSYQRLYLTYDDHPNRTFIEPVLRQNALEVVYEWAYMVREDLSSVAVPEGGPAVRAASESDLEAIAALDSSCYEAAPLGLAEQKYITAAVGVVGQPPLLVAVEDGTVAGYAHLTVEDSPIGQVARLGVDPEWRRRGVGLALLTHALSRWREAGRIRGTALAPVESKAAIGLCRKAGFVFRRTVLLYGKEPGARPKRTLGLIGLRGVWET